ATEILYETKPTTSITQKRLIERVRSVYYNYDLTGPMPLSEVAAQALPYQSYKMAFTPGLITQVYGNRVTGSLFVDEAKYLFQDGGCWIPSGRQVFDAAQFYLPVQSIDPFGNTSNITYDQYMLLVTRLVDPLANTVSAQNNYRVMLPWHLTD